MPRTLYDELAYPSFPIEWTAPERLALASLLHGGPRMRLEGCRVLELGCGDGTNLIRLADERRDATFVGVDSALSRIAVAQEKRSSLGLTNVDFLTCDFRDATGIVSGAFDFIIAHGVFSWVAPDVRDAVLRLCAGRLRQGGLFYLNYNARPGWNVRGLVRNFLLNETRGVADLLARATQARAVAATVAAELQGGEHPWSQLLAWEFRFAAQNEPSYIAHEYLAEYNHAYARAEFLDMVAPHGFAYVAEADFNYPSGRLPEGLPSRLESIGLDSWSFVDTADLLCYRQVHSPILAQQGFERQPPNLEELSSLVVASCLVERKDQVGNVVYFDHPSGYEVEARNQKITEALKALQRSWPKGSPLAEVFPDVTEVIDDVRLLHRNGMIELRVR